MYLSWRDPSRTYACGGRGRGCRGLLGRRRGGVGRGEVRRAGRGLLRRRSCGALVMSHIKRDDDFLGDGAVLRLGRTAVGSSVGEKVGSSVGAAVGSCAAARTPYDYRRGATSKSKEGPTGVG
jgi:hypothetical protein